jgi:hypothetical protein
MCFNFLTGRTGPSTGPQSKADIAAGGYRPPVNIKSNAPPANAGNPQSDTGTPQGRRAATQNQQTVNRNRMRRADSYGSRNSGVQGGKSIMGALNNNKSSQQTKTKSLLGQ